METTKRNMFYNLYKKDLKTSRFELLLIMGIILAVNLYVFYKTANGWPLRIGVAINIGGIIAMPIAIFAKAFVTVRNEWKENTVYLMMSLPVSGRMIFLSKLLSLLTQWIVLEVLLGVCAFFFLRGTMTPYDWQHIAAIPFEIKMEIIKVLFLIFLGVTQTLILAFFSSVIGRLFNKFSGLITVGVFFGAGSLISKVSDIIINSISKYHLENLGNGQINISGNMAFSNTEYMGILLVLIGISAALFFGTAAIYDRKVEL